MKPANCLKHDDCVRACVASILEMETENVPHWFDGWNEANGEDLNRSMQEWFAARGEVAAVIGLPGNWQLDEVKHYMTIHYHDKYYMLWCNSNGDHAVVGRNDEIVHNPAWYRSPIDGPHSQGMWIVWLIAELK